MWQDVLTLLSFAFTILGLSVALLAWLQITPQHLRDLTRDRVIRNRLLWPILVSILGTVFVVWDLRTPSTPWWSYLETGWVCAVFWTRYVAQRRNSIPLIYAVALSPVMYLATILLSIYKAIYHPSPDQSGWAVTVLLVAFAVMAIAVGTVLTGIFEDRRNSAIENEWKEQCVKCKEHDAAATEAFEHAEELAASADLMRQRLNGMIDEFRKRHPEATANDDE